MGSGMLGGRLIGIDHGLAPEGGRRTGAALVRRGRRVRGGQLASSHDGHGGDHQIGFRKQSSEFDSSLVERLFVTIGGDPDFMPERVDVRPRTFSPGDTVSSWDPTSNPKSPFVAPPKPLPSLLISISSPDGVPLDS